MLLVAQLFISGGWCRQVYRVFSPMVTMDDRVAVSIRG